VKQAHQRFDDCSKIIIKQRIRLQISWEIRIKKYIYFITLYIIAWNLRVQSAFEDLYNTTPASFLNNCRLFRKLAGLQPSSAWFTVKYRSNHMTFPVLKP